MIEGPDLRRVFVVHGRNLAARDGVFTFLRAIALDPIEWEEAIEMTGEASPYIGTVLDTAFANAQAVVVLLTPDEVTYLRSEYSDGEEDPETEPAAQARANVLFEAGMAMGRDAKRTVLVEFGQLRPFSDVVGRHAIRLLDTASKRKALAQRLKTAGCAVNMSGDDWLQAGDLTPPAPPGAGLPLGKRVPRTSGASCVRIDLRFHRGSKGGGRLEIINRGTEEVFDLDIELPPEAEGFDLIRQELPLVRLPAGKSATLPAIRYTASGGKDNFDVRITGRTADGTPVSEAVFLSLGA